MALIAFGSVAAGFAAELSPATEKLLAAAAGLRDKGEFKKAESLLGAALKKQNGLQENELKKIAFEADLLRRIRQDFSLTGEQLFDRLAKSLDGLTRQEFHTWMADGRFESRVIDGTRYFADTSVSNLYFRHPELNARRRAPRDISYYAKVLENCRVIQQAAKREKKPYVLPHRLKMTLTVTVKSNTVPHGEIIRAWLPVPRKYPFQKDFQLLNSSSPVLYLADEQSPIRSAYLEQPAQNAAPTQFQIQHEYTTHGIRFDLRPEKVKPYNPDDPIVQQFTRESPHVVFTDRIRALSQQIVGPETNALKKARAIYDWIGGNIKYSYALEYSTITNISDYCLSKNYGDCGQQALLFITLCRAQGIPARWQSGWFVFPGHINIHDWSEIYIPPYGWIPVDADLGNALVRYATLLTPEERREARDFYFGGLDQYRMAANSDHSQPLNPAKKWFRSDDVDFQRGELEWDGGNIYFDRYSYSAQVEQVSP